MWDAGQKKTFAKELWLSEFENGRALKYLTVSMREALVSHRLLRILSSQASESITVEAIDDLIDGVRKALLTLSKNPYLFGDEQ